LNRITASLRKSQKPMMGFNTTIDGTETAHIIQKRQLSEENIAAYKQFMALAG
jgi:putative transposase